MIFRWKSRLLIAIAPWPWWYRYLMTGLAVLVLVGFWWLLSYRNLLRQVANLNKTLSAYHQIEVPDPLAANEVLNASSEAEQEKLFFDFRHVRDFVRYLSDICSKRNLQLKKYRLLTRHRESWSDRVTVELGVQGDFFDQVALFESLASYKNLLIERLSFEVVDRNVLRTSATIFLYLPILE